MAKVDGMSWSEIESLVKKYRYKLCSAVAGKIRDELYDEAKSAISDFYRSYDPLFYRRHYWNFEEFSFKKYYSNKHNSVFYGGVELTPQELKPIYQEDNTQEVFDTVFAGFHGVAGMFYTPKTFKTIPPRMIPSPRQRLLDKQKYIFEHKEKYVAYGRRIAQKSIPLFK